MCVQGGAHFAAPTCSRKTTLCACVRVCREERTLKHPYACVKPPCVRVYVCAGSERTLTHPHARVKPHPVRVNVCAGSERTLQHAHWGPALSPSKPLTVPAADPPPSPPPFDTLLFDALPTESPTPLAPPPTPQDTPRSSSASLSAAAAAAAGATGGAAAATPPPSALAHTLPGQPAAAASSEKVGRSPPNPHITSILPRLQSLHVRSPLLWGAAAPKSPLNQTAGLLVGGVMPTPLILFSFLVCRDKRCRSRKPRPGFINV